MSKRIQIFISQPAIFSRFRHKQVKEAEFEARLYFAASHFNEAVSYFSGRGRSAAEAIGTLVCRFPEQFNAKIEIVMNPDALNQNEIVFVGEIPDEGRCCFCKQPWGKPHLANCVQHGGHGCGEDCRMPPGRIQV
jgi:hypothetical protein